ncbi:MAG: DUF4407 domain-containing protein, partial [Propioniciclava sp.]
EGATGATGCGDRCQDLIDQATAAQDVLPEALAAQQAIIADADAELGRMDAEQERAIADARAELERDNGFFAREKVLFEMLMADRHLLFKYLLIAGILLVLEMAGVLTKLVAHNNTYERHVARSVRIAERAELLQARHISARMHWRAKGNIELQKASDVFYRANGVELNPGAHGRLMAGQRSRPVGVAGVSLRRRATSSPRSGSAHCGGVRQVPSAWRAKRGCSRAWTGSCTGDSQRPNFPAR